jgi:ketosteroid isomerase-like protein
MARSSGFTAGLAGTGALAALLVLATPGPALAAAKEKAAAPSPQDEVRAVEMARADALLHADTTALSRMTANDFVEISRFGQLRTKADNMRDVGSGDLKLATVKYDSLTVRVYGDVAVLQGIADNTGSFRGMPFAGKIRYTRIFIRRDHRWQAVAMQHTMMP